MNEFIKLITLAIVQGATEFLPVSSSGHLVLTQSFLDLKIDGVFIELLLHVGTILSIVIFYRKRILELIQGVFKLEKFALLYLLWIIISMIPAGILYLMLGDSLKGIYDNPTIVACLLLVTGILMLSFKYLDKRDSNKELSPVKAFLIGCAQAFAVLPGISRSGSTIWTARLLRIKPEQAAEFSLFMSMPVIIGATLVEMLEAENTNSILQTYSIAELLIAMCVTCIVGCLAIKLLVKTLVNRKFWIFGIYCIAVALISLATSIF
ncbi:MAG: undecaprenyl-diphosphate phosphatase [Kiritimatiellae bacterium]|nr:undecaprenyl-diphosphate phosphatase [Kiritimatiellia bacterium]